MPVFLAVLCAASTNELFEFESVLQHDRYLNAVSVGLHSQQRVNEKCVFLSISLTTFWFAVHVS